MGSPLDYNYYLTGHGGKVYPASVDPTSQGGFVLRAPDGSAMGDIASPVSEGSFEILKTSDITLWNTDKTAALTVEVDNTVLFDGRPSLKITIPAGTSGTIKVGTNVANALAPYGWDRKDYALAVMYSGFTGYDWAASFPPAIATYFGDATYTNFWTVSGTNLASFPETKPRADEWCVFKPAVASWAVGGGSPSTAAAMRCKLQWTQVSQATDCVVYIGFMGKMPARTAKATLVWCMDDGYATWDSFLKPLFKHYNMPVSLGVTKDYVGTATFLTEAQIRDMAQDTSRLFDFINHATDNTGYTSLGAAAYYAQVEENRDYMRSLGITGDGPLHHAWVQSQWGNDAVDLLSAGGFLTARGGALTAYQNGRDQLIRSGDDKLRWFLAADLFLGSATSLATAQTAVDNAVTNQEFMMIGGHNFAAASDTYVWTYSDMVQLVGYVQSKVAAGTLEVKSWSRWYADLTGRNCDRR